LKEIEAALKMEGKLLSLFRKMLPHEKGFILSQTNPSADVSEELVAEYFPEVRRLPLLQKAQVLRYVAFLVALYRYEGSLKALDREGGVHRARIEDERRLRLARLLMKESPRGRKPKKRRQLERLKGEILRLRSEGMGPTIISKYLLKAHRLRVSREYLRQVLREWELL